VVINGRDENNVDPHTLVNDVGSSWFEIIVELVLKL
jgi:hypothetical protein